MNTLKSVVAAVTLTFVFSRVQDYIFGQVPVVDGSLTV